MEDIQGNNNKLPSNLPQLQNLIKRDSVSYEEEFERQHAIYNATVTIFEQNPTVFNRDLHELVMFMAQVAHCYPKQLKEYPQDLMTLLKRHATVLHPEMRMSLVKALVLLRNKNLLSPTDLHILFFQLLRCQDKTLRAFLQQHIITDIKNINSKSKNMKLNRELQNFMYEMLKAKHAVAAKTSLSVMIDLYNKKVWNDSKTVNIITTACFHKVTKIMVAAIKFFVGKDDDEEENESDSESDGDDEQAALKATVNAYRVNKKTKKRKQKKTQQAKKVVKKNIKSKTKKFNMDFSALHLIHDPQDMADRLYKKLEGMNERFEVKLLTMNLISRLIGIHKLYLPNFYPMLQRYLYPHQREVTKVMVFAAQAAHSEVPPDDLEPVIRALANNFVTERYSNEVMAMGLNAIRELCSRNPFGMSEELIQDLAAYKSHKDKGVSMASRSLIILFRDKNPSLLVRKDRGAPTELKAEEKTEVFGGNNAKAFIPGAEILSFNVANDDDGGDDDGDDESDIDGEGWIDVDHSEMYVNGSDDSDDDNKNESKEKELTTNEAVQEVMKLTPKERAERAQDIVSSRFLTDKDFAKIAAVQAAKYVEKFSLSKKKKNSKRKFELIEENKETGELVPLKNIEMIYKKRKHDKEARMGTVLAGREGREKFGQKKGKINPHASTTNKEKKKGKNFMMLKHKVRGKQKVSFRDKQLKLKKALLKRQKFK